MATKGFKAGTLTARIAGARAAYTRAYNKLQTQYNAASTAGQKAAIKRKMNAL